MLYGLTRDRKQAFHSQCDWKPFVDGDTLKPTDLYSGTDGGKIYIQLVFQPSEFIYEVTFDASDIALEGYGFIRDVVSDSTWEAVVVATQPLVAVYSVVADGSTLSTDLTYTIIDYTSFVDANDEVIVDATGDAIGVVA